MIHLLQTGDLHLGKIFYGNSLFEDQKFVLKQLIDKVSEAKEKEPYNAIIISGDIYDRSIPPTEAIEIFDDFLIELHKIDANLKILIISGNHDSATRLSFGTKFLEKQNIHFCTNPENCTTPIIITGNNFKENDKDAICFYQIPFLNSGSLYSEEKNQRLINQQELISEAINRIKIQHESNSKTKNLPMALNAHLFTLGSISSESERTFLGNAEFINKEIFEDFIYVALGHLHKKQKVCENCFYSGSPLAYSFDEANLQKVFLDIKIDTQKKESSSKIKINEIEISPLHKVQKLTGKFEDFYRMTKDSEFYKYKNDYLEITCTDEILIENPVARLRENFPFILSIKQQAFFNQEKNKTSLEKKEVLLQNQNLDSSKLFIEFVKDVESTDNIEEWESTNSLFCKIAKSVLEEE